MLHEKGQVIAISPGQVTVAVLKTSACQSCKARHACGQAVLSQVADSANQEAKNHFAIPHEGKAQLGDWVTLAIEEDRLTRAAFWLYLWPLLVGFALLLIGSAMALSEPVQLLMALVGGASALMVTRHRFKSAAQHWGPRIVRPDPSPAPASDQPSLH